MVLKIMPMEEFKFEHQYKISEKEYGDVFSTLSPKSLNRIFRRTIIVLITILCFFWAYTFVLGLLGMLLILLGFFMPHLIPGSVKKQYHDSKILGVKYTYGVSNEAIWISGKGLDAKASWNLLSVWRIRGNWLILQVERFPEILLPIDQLEANGSFLHVMELVKKYGKEFKK
jgi:hypothetical protein